MHQKKMSLHSAGNQSSKDLTELGQETAEVAGIQLEFKNASRRAAASLTTDWISCC